MPAKKIHNVFSLADERINKPVFTPDELYKVYSPIQDLNLKFYCIASLILITKDIIEVYNSEKIRLLVNSKYINKIASDFNFDDYYCEFDFRRLTGEQLKFIEYLKSYFLPILIKEYRKLIPLLRKNLNADDFKELTISNNLLTFNYNVRMIMMYAKDVLLLPQVQGNYLIQLKKKLRFDIISNPDSVFIKKYSAHILCIIDDTIEQIRLPKENGIASGGNCKSGALPFLDIPKNTNLIESNPSDSQIWKIKDDDKLICLGSETKLRKFISLVQGHDIIERLPDDEESQRMYFSLFLNPNYSNYYPDYPGLSNLRPVRIKVKISDFVYIIGQLCKSKYNKKYLFDGTNNWSKVSKLFLNMKGGRLDNESMSQQYSRMNKHKKFPRNCQIFNTIISLILNTK